MVNTTVSGNAAIADPFGCTMHTASGGGLMVTGSGSVLRNVTIVGNEARADGQGCPVQQASAVGAGLRYFLDLLAVSHVVVADNFGGGGFLPTGSCSGDLASLGFNLADDASCDFDAATDLVPVEPLLGALASNGGPTRTHLPAPGSAVLDSGDPAGCADPDGAPLPIDQRGVARPLDAGGGAVCDRGAVEREGLAPTPSPSPSPDPTPSPSPDPTPSPIPDPTPSPSPDPTPSPSPDPTPTPSPDPTPTPSPEPTPTPSPDPTPSPSPDPTPTPTPSPSPLPTPSPSPTSAPTPTAATVASCAPSPLSGCTAAPSSAAKVRGGDPVRARLSWSARRFPITAAELGDPVAGGTSYAVCVYADGALAGEPIVLEPGGTCAGRPCWRRLGERGYRWDDRTRSRGPGTTFLLREGGGRGKIRFEASGSDLPGYALFPAADVVTVQLVTDPASAAGCWEAAFPAPPRQSSAERFKDTLP